MAESGILKRFRDMYYPKPQEEDAKNEGKVFSLFHLQGNFLILIFGIAVAGLTLVAEHLWLACQGNDRKHRERIFYG